MERPPILLGEAPSKSGDKYHMFPLSGAVAETLCKLAGIPPLAGESRYGQWTWALYDHFECENLIERWPGAQGRGAAFPLDVARPLAFAKAEHEMEARVVVLLGARLRDLFEVPIFYEWQTYVQVWEEDRKRGFRSECMVAAIPHPSGLNRMLNGGAEREKAGQVLRDAMTRATMLAA